MNEFVYPEIKSGLYLVSLPVGCLSDISFRALHMLSNSDYVAGEDTRSVRSLFKLLKISKSIKSIISYHDHSSAHTRGKIIELIKQGKSVALVSDAGTPLISDPGYKLVKTTIEEGFEVFSVPGPSSVIAALTVSGLPTDAFSFLGFLPNTKSKKKKLLETYLNLGSSLIIFESGKRLQKTLELLAETCRPSTEICICRELTKLNEEVLGGEAGIKFLKKELKLIIDKPIKNSGSDLLVPQKGKLNVWLLVGVNGVGKTTTLGKLAYLSSKSNYKTLIAAADTFRAAAVEQLKVWGDRSNVDVISNQSKNADPAAVVFDAINSAKKRNVDLLLVDTAGRLQTKNNLMDELAKIKKIIDKKVPDAIVESLLVLDASQGQNGLKQAKSFAKSADLSGAIITKLDGTSRGGVSLAVSEEVNLPIRFIGAGEGIKDLRPFNSYEFVEAMLADK